MIDRRDAFQFLEIASALIPPAPSVIKVQALKPATDDRRPATLRPRDSDRRLTTGDPRHPGLPRRLRVGGRTGATVIHH